MSKGITGTLDLRAHEAEEWVLLAPLPYVPEVGEVITVPAGFMTDLASIPSPFRPVLDRNGKSRKPAVLHDWRYCLKAGTRADADALFLEALKAEGVSLVERWAMYLGVRAGGWVYWKKRDGLKLNDFIQ